MGITTGEGCGTAATIFSKMDSVLKGHSIPWQNCIALSVDNASVNMGDRNSIKSRVLKENPSVFILGCPSHIVHNNASAAGAVYREVNCSISLVIEEALEDRALQRVPPLLTYNY